MATSIKAVQESSPGPSYAGLFRRIVAYLVDVLVAFALLVLVALTMRFLRAVGIWTPLVGRYFGPEQAWQTLGVASKLLIVVAFVVSQGAFYLILFEASPWQATLGKRLLNIYVTDEGGHRIRLARSFGRWLAMWGFGWFGGSLVSLISIPATKNRQGLHDIAAGTLVPSGQPPPAEPMEPWRVLGAFGLPYVWLIATFMYTL